MSLIQVGDVNLQTGDRSATHAAYEESLAISRTLAEADPGNAQAQGDLSVSLDRIGNVKLQAGDGGGALAAYEEGTATARALAEADPGNVETQRHLSVSSTRSATSSSRLATAAVRSPPMRRTSPSAARWPWPIPATRRRNAILSFH